MNIHTAICLWMGGESINKKITLQVILTAVVYATDVSEKDIKSKSKKPEYTLPRFMYYYLSQKYTHHSLREIGELVGGRNHATIIHGIKSMKDWLETNNKGAVELHQKCMKELTSYGNLKTNKSIKKDNDDTI